MPGDDLRAHYRRGRRAALLGVAGGLILGLVKLAGGLVGNSIALVSDAVHSLGDALTSVAIFGSLYWAQQPPDREHPYGHSRVEAAVGSNVALLIVLSALGIVWETVSTWAESSALPEWYTLVIAAVAAVVKEGLYHYNNAAAKRTGSSAVKASAWDHRLDALGSVAVLAGLALALWGGFHAADHVAALAVAAVMLWAGVRLFWGSLQELMDRQADPEMLDEVRREARAVEGVRGVEKVLVRKTGMEYLVDIHVEVDPDMPVRDGHAVAHAVKDRLLKQFVTVKDVLVHIEPAPGAAGR
jgi:cation diffusion facilitator family transporter